MQTGTAKETTRGAAEAGRKHLKLVEGQRAEDVDPGNFVRSTLVLNGKVIETRMKIVDWEALYEEFGIK